MTHGNFKHGMIRTPEYHAWSNMKQRCADKSSPNYGGRNISVCARWEVFENFYEDMGPKPSCKHTLERIDVNGDYGPTNCMWATYKVQSLNKRNTRYVLINGERMKLAEASEKLGIQVRTLHYRASRNIFGVSFA